MQTKISFIEIDNKQPAVFPTSMIGTSHSEIQNQLAEAHSTVFDAELFSDVSLYIAKGVEIL
jgi:hypothetical protein